MRKIINGKMYNTETAKLIAEWWNGLSRGDFHILQKDLYLKRTGEFFLHCQGGGATSYAEHTASGYCYGEAIEPLAIEEAKEFLADHDFIEEYIELFGEPEE